MNTNSLLNLNIIMLKKPDNLFYGKLGGDFEVVFILLRLGQSSVCHKLVASLALLYLYNKHGYLLRSANLVFMFLPEGTWKLDLKETNYNSILPPV